MNYNEKLERYLQAQRLCLGLDSTQYKFGNIVYTGPDISLTSNNVDDLDPSTLTESGISDSFSKTTSDWNVYKEARFMRDLGNSIKAQGYTDSFQQFSRPPRRMRGTGSSGWTLHNTGEAIDLFAKNNSKLLTYINSKVDEWGLMLIIDYHNQQIWSRKRGWHFSRSVSTSYKHIHIDRQGWRRNGQGYSPQEVAKLRVEENI